MVLPRVYPVHLFGKKVLLRTLDLLFPVAVQIPEGLMPQELWSAEPPMGLSGEPSFGAIAGSLT
jgi:hypothetical protein